MGLLSKLGRYEIVRVLGKGAMGTVYEARDPNLERRVAIKTIAVQGLSAEGVADYEARFRTEARSAARLQHPNIVSVYDSGRDGDVAYLVMEYVQGQDLKHHLDAGMAFTLEQTLRIMRDLLSALAYAHAQAIVHRDVKPANLLMEADGRVKLTDFGVARIQDAGDATRTRGTMVGTLKYMSPEQVQGQPIDARSDLFSAGIVLYQLLTGRQPFRGDNEFAIIAQIIGVDPAAPSTVQPALPAAVDAVLDRALAKSPEQRFADARAFRDALVQAFDQVQDLSTAPMPLEPGSASDSGRRQSGSSGSGASDGARAGPTVTQELELVYWKDVRDSDDALDLQGFLDRFPDGIYADLARRRLRKLGIMVIGEQTATLVEPRIADADATQATDRTAPVAPVAAQRDARRRSATRVRSAAVTVVVLAAIALAWLFAGERPADRMQADAVPASQMPASGAAEPGAETVGASTPVVTPSDAGHGAAVADRLRRPEPVAGAKAKSVAGARVAATGDAGATVTVSPSASAAVAVDGGTPAPRAIGDAGPEQACAGRVLLGYQICMSEQCAKPMYAGYPVCELRRAADLARKQQQANRN